MGIKTTFTKNLPLIVFELITYQNVKTHAKHLLWRNRIKLPKTYILWVLIMLSIKTLKYIQRTLCLRNERHYEKCVLSVFLSSLSTKKLKPTNNTLYIEKKSKKIKK